MPDSSDLLTELNFVKALAVESAALAKGRCQRVTPQEKANLSYVTDLDQDLERLIRQRLGERFPDDLITGEEYAPEGGSGPRRWSIDPIDGTGNLVHGLPLWAISIGLMVAGEPVLGVIAIPPLDELFWAVKGAGAWLDGQRLATHDAANFTIKTMSVSAPMRFVRSIPELCRAGSATWAVPAASRLLWRQIGFKPPLSLANKLTMSPRGSSSPPRRDARSLPSMASDSPRRKWCDEPRSSFRRLSRLPSASMPSLPPRGGSLEQSRQSGRTNPVLRAISVRAKCAKSVICPHAMGEKMKSWVC